MVDALRFGPAGRVPNSALPVLVHRGALPPGAGAAAHAALFARHCWSNAWRDGVYPFHHFHSTAHEVLGVYGGRATLRLGGETGRDRDLIRAGAASDEDLRRAVAAIAGLPGRDPATGEPMSGHRGSTR